MILKCLCFIVFLYSGLIQAQTKLVYFKSHSGNAAYFRMAYRDGLFDMDNSNFGEAPQRFVTESELDSVIFISDSVAVMVTSEYCGISRRIKSTGYLWRAGADTVINHPLFTLKHNLDSIRKVLKRDYFFRNSIDSVKFVGYDNKKPDNQQQDQQDQRQDIMPVSDSGNGTPDNNLPVLIMVLITLSALTGFFSWRYVKP
mgnify:CR=1 FL=1